MMPCREQETDWETVRFNQDVKTFVSHIINLCTFYGFRQKKSVKLIFI